MSKPTRAIAVEGHAEDKAFALACFLAFTGRSMCIFDCKGTTCAPGHAGKKTVRLVPMPLTHWPGPGEHFGIAVIRVSGILVFLQFERGEDKGDRDFL